LASAIRHVLSRRLFEVALLPLFGLSACAVNDSRIADRAQKQLIGMQEVDLESCIGVPDQHASFGSTDVLTYYATSSSSTSYSVPIVGGLGMSNGGYCHATVRVDNGLVTQVLYSGEKNQTLAPNAYCAPIIRTCMAWLDAHPQARSRTNADPHYMPTNTPAQSSSGTVPPGAPSGTPQPGASHAGTPANMPSPTPR
jgi:hypothetical protein